MKAILRRLYLLIGSLRFGGVWCARKQGVRIGNNCRIYTTSFGSEPFLISIGDHVTITSGVKLLTHDGATWLIRDAKGRRYKFGRIEIGNHVFIGVNTIVMPGVTIGDRVIVAAGSVVTKSIESNSVYGGNPARRICSYDDYESKALAFPSEAEWNQSDSYENNVMQQIALRNEPETKL